MSEDVSSKVKKIVADHLGIDESKVNEESSFIDDLGADSLDTVELVMAFEEEFNIEIPDDVAEKIVIDSRGRSSATDRLLSPDGLGGLHPRRVPQPLTPRCHPS
mgnify:CR=1 FL=1